MRTRFLTMTTAAVAALAVLAGCGGSPTPTSGTAGDSATTGVAGATLVVATHDSWAMSKKVMDAFTRETGIEVTIQSHGDAGELTNKLVLTKDVPIADGVFGIDNTFATRATDAGVLTPYTSPALPASASAFALPGDAAADLTPIDYGDVCVNVDDTWFAAHDLAEPKTLQDLADPAYRNLTVTPGATTSSTGLAFLLGTVGAFGDGWTDYWKSLVANGLKVDAGWTDAYEVDFTAGGGNGDRPIVVSYSSSPPFTIPKGKSRPTTSALLDTCFRQVEYAGVLAGSKNPVGMEKFIDFMLSHQFQAALPENMYVYPIDTTVALPRDWARWAPTADKPFTVAPADISSHRSEWLSTWRDLISG